MKSIVLGLFAIIAMNFGLTESKTSVSEEVLENAEALRIKSLPETCSACVGVHRIDCLDVYVGEGEVIVTLCKGEKVEED